MDEVLEFINRRFPDKSTWLSGNCYYFAIILKERFNGIIYYDVIAGHFIVEINHYFYDNDGLVNIVGRKLVSWDDFEKYDSLQKERIIRDCVK